MALRTKSQTTTPKFTLLRVNWVQGIQIFRLKEHLLRSVGDLRVLNFVLRVTKFSEESKIYGRSAKMFQMAGPIERYLRTSETFQKRPATPWTPWNSLRHSELLLRPFGTLLQSYNSPWNPITPPKMSWGHVEPSETPEKPQKPIRPPEPKLSICSEQKTFSCLVLQFATLAGRWIN